MVCRGLGPKGVDCEIPQREGYGGMPRAGSPKGWIVRSHKGRRTKHSLQECGNLETYP